MYLEFGSTGTYVGKSHTRQFRIALPPGVSSAELAIEKVPRADKGITVGLGPLMATAVKVSTDDDAEVFGTVTWTPQAAGNIAETLQFMHNGRYRLEVKVTGSAVPSKSSKTGRTTTAKKTAALSSAKPRIALSSLSNKPFAPQHPSTVDKAKELNAVVKTATASRLNPAAAPSQEDALPAPSSTNTARTTKTAPSPCRVHVCLVLAAAAAAAATPLSARLHLGALYPLLCQQWQQDLPHRPSE